MANTANSKTGMEMPMIQISDNVIYLPGNSDAETTVNCSGDSGDSDSGNSGYEYGNVRIELQRFGYATNSTIGVFEAHAYDENGNESHTMSGFMLERKYDPNLATTEGSKCAIESGTYTFDRSTYTNSNHQTSPCLRLSGVPGRSNILIHAGNTFDKSTGCLLTGSQYASDTTDYSVAYSKNKLTELLEFVNNYGNGKGTIVIDN